jgi:hypothetical protein
LKKKTFQKFEFLKRGVRNTVLPESENVLLSKREQERKRKREKREETERKREKKIEQPLLNSREEGYNEAPS